MNFAVIFSGQGLQSIRHIQEIQEIQEIQDKAEQFGLSTQLAPLFSQLKQTESEQDAIFDNRMAQPLIFALQYLRWLQVQEHLPEPEFFAGYSLGEASAFCCSSSLSFSQSFELISTRARLMSQYAYSSCGMLAIQGLNRQQLLPLLQKSDTEISIRLNEMHYIVAGTTPAIEHLMVAATEHGAQHISKLKVSIPSHSSFLSTAAAEFSAYFSSLPESQMRYPIISASAGRKYFSHSQAVSVLSEQINHSLDWYTCMETLQEYRPDVILEIGPGNALSKMISEVMPDVQIRSMDDFSSFDGVRQWISRFI